MNLNKTNGVRRVPSAMVGTAPRVEILMVTPEMAKTWLSRNSGNQRSVSKKTVEMYARDMARGAWQLTHQGISFNQTGEVIDGQHRLHAIIQSGVTVQMAVATGFFSEYDSPIDQGRARSARDILHRHNRWVAIVRMLRRMQVGNVTIENKMSIAEITESAAVHSEALEAVWPALRALPTGFSSSVAWALPLSPDRVMSFASQVATGEMLERGDPAYALRVWKERNRRAKVSDDVFAACNCLRAMLNSEHIASVYTGSTGYRWLCQRRRVERIPNTPSAQDVPAVSNG